MDSPKWAIVEIMGHRVVAGRLSWGEVPYGQGVAIDVPLTDGTFLQEYYSGGAQRRLSVQART